MGSERGVASGVCDGVLSGIGEGAAWRTSTLYAGSSG